MESTTTQKSIVQKLGAGVKAFSLRGARAASRGVTLIEIMVVLAIVGLIAGGIAFVAIPKLADAKKQQAHTDALKIRQAAQQWKTDHGGEECPNTEKLRSDKLIDQASKAKDPWDQEYKIICEDQDEITVYSTGPDKKESGDDIRVPDKQLAK